MKIGVVIGRFQVPELTIGHIDLLNKARRENDGIVVLLGTPAFQNDRNPLDFSQRVSVVREKFPTTPVLPLFDNISDEVWSRTLDDTLKRTYPHATFTLYHGRDSFAPHYKGKFPLVEIVTSNSPSGTEVRAKVAAHPVYTQEYRKGYIAAHEHSFPAVRLAVDIIMMNDIGDVLLVKKPNEDKWRFPGGMVEKGERALAAAKRELLEETGLEGVNWQIIDILPVEDWRGRGSKHGVASGIFLTEYCFGKAVAQDDVSDVMWAPKSRLDFYLIPEHREFLKAIKLV